MSLNIILFGLYVFEFYINWISVFVSELPVKFGTFTYAETVSCSSFIPHHCRVPHYWIYQARHSRNKDMCLKFFVLIFVCCLQVRMPQKTPTISFLRNSARYVTKSQFQGSNVGFTSVTLDWLLNLSEPQFPSLSHGNNNSIYLIVLLQ